MAESPLQARARARQRLDAAEAEREKIFRVRGGEFVEVPQIGPLEALSSSVFERGVEAASAVEQFFSDDVGRQQIQERQRQRFIKGSERRIQQPFANVLGDVLPVAAAELVQRTLPGQVATGFLEGFTRVNESRGGQILSGAQSAALAAAGNRLVTAGTTRLGPLDQGVVRGGTSRSQELRRNLLREGIVLSPAELADNKLLRALEVGIETLPFGSEPVAARRALNQARVNQSARKALGLEDIESDVVTLEDLALAKEFAIDGIEQAGINIDATTRGPLRATPGEVARVRNVIQSGRRNLATGETAVPEAEDLLNMLEGDRAFTGADLVEQRRNFVAATQDAGNTKAAGLAELSDVLDEMVASRLSGVEREAFATARENFRVAATLEKPGALTPEGNVATGKAAARRLTGTFRPIPRREPTVQTKEVADFIQLQEGMALDAVLPFRSSGTAERITAASLLGAGNVGLGGGESDPLLRFLTGAAVPTLGARLLTTQTGRALLSPSTRASGRGAALATAAGTEQAPTRADIEEGRRRRERE